MFYSFKDCYSQIELRTLNLPSLFIFLSSWEEIRVLLSLFSSSFVWSKSLLLLRSGSSKAALLYPVNRTCFPVSRSYSWTLYLDMFVGCFSCTEESLPILRFPREISVFKKSKVARATLNEPPLFSSYASRPWKIKIIINSRLQLLYR